MLDVRVWSLLFQQRLVGLSSPGLPSDDNDAGNVHGSIAPIQDGYIAGSRRDHFDMGQTPDGGRLIRVGCTGRNRSGGAQTLPRR